MNKILTSTKKDGAKPACLERAGSAPASFPYFHSGNEKQDVACLLDMAIDIIEIWDVKNSPYNQELKRCWMKRAQELGANIAW